MSGWFFNPLQMFGFDVVEIDLPARFETYSDKGNTKSGEAYYNTMSWDEAAAMPVGHLVRGNGIVLLWGWPPSLDKSFWLLKCWGARYKTELVWPKGRVGTGYRSRGMHESVLLGVFGDECQIHETFFGIIKGKYVGHSVKPTEWYEDIVAKTPCLDRLALFARRQIPGFTTWGDQSDLLSAGERPMRKQREMVTPSTPLFDGLAGGA